jgi:hypothetical protein
VRGPGAINERTFYNVERERAVFAATGQEVEIPLCTYHAPDRFVVAPRLSWVGGTLSVAAVGVPDPYEVVPQPLGTPFVHYAVEHDPESDGIIDHLVSYEVNVEST